MIHNRIYFPEKTIGMSRNSCYLLSLWVALICLAGFASKVSSDSVLNVIVSDFKYRGIDSTAALIISDRFRASFHSHAKLNVLERNQIEAILKRQGFKKSSTCDYDACLIESGKFLGAHFVVSGTVGKVEDIFSFNIKIINILSGKTETSAIKDVKRPLMEVLNVVVPELAAIISSDMTTISLVAIEIRSKPENAIVRLNDSVVGRTPMILNDLVEGRHLLELSLDHCINIRDTIFIQKGTQLSKLYEFKYSDEYSKHVSLKKKRMIRWVIQGTGAVGSLCAMATGGYYDYKLNGIAMEQQRILDDYLQAGDGATFESYKRDYEIKKVLFDRWEKYRNASYLTGILLASGVSVSFLF